MSHDRGCPCGRESYEYHECDRPLNKCFKDWARQPKKEENGKGTS